VECLEIVNGRRLFEVLDDLHGLARLIEAIVHEFASAARLGAAGVVVNGDHESMAITGRALFY
jgi:hypothetical protein